MYILLSGNIKDQLFLTGLKIGIKRPRARRSPEYVHYINIYFATNVMPLLHSSPCSLLNIYSKGMPSGKAGHQLCLVYSPVFSDFNNLHSAQIDNTTLIVALLSQIITQLSLDILYQTLINCVPVFHFFRQLFRHFAFLLQLQRYSPPRLFLNPNIEIFPV